MGGDFTGSGGKGGHDGFGFGSIYEQKMTIDFRFIFVYSEGGFDLGATLSKPAVSSRLVAIGSLRRVYPQPS